MLYVNHFLVAKIDIFFVVAAFRDVTRRTVNSPTTSHIQMDDVLLGASRHDWFNLSSDIFDTFSLSSPVNSQVFDKGGATSSSISFLNLRIFLRGTEIKLMTAPIDIHGLIG